MDEQKFNRIARDILESLYYFISVDREGKITFINREYAEHLGYSQEELIGRHAQEVIPGTRMHIVLQEEKEELGCYMSIQGANGNPLSTVCNRLLIYQDGDRDSGKIVGAMAEGVIRNFQDTGRVYEEIELLRNQNDLYQSHLAQLYQVESDLESILGQSAAIQKLKNLIRRVANSAITVCISGETGTGKELAANAIHKLSKRAEKPFVKINCAAIPKDLLESELFGYEAGAFTGANRQGKVGRFELANHGTLLLDEIGEMPFTLQAKLLRVLQEQEIERVGGVRPIPLDVRLICSTNRDLAQMVANGQFRADLYYRLNTMELSMPPLRDRLEDLPELCELFVKRANQCNGLAITGIHPDVYTLFQSYSWPGNVRELEHTLERASVLLGYGELNVTHFDFLADRIKVQHDGRSKLYGNALKDRKDALEREAILQALMSCHGNKSAAAKVLEIDRTVLYAKMKKHNIT